jgi:chromosome segregation ATPase
LKSEFEEEKNALVESLDRLELANEQLLAGGENSGMEQLQMELTRLQKQNTVLSQRERELQFQLSTKDMLQKEVQHLQELNEQLLENRLPAETESESGNKMLERIATLEIELAEAMEVNNLYKSQLHTAFADQKVVQAPAAGGDEEITKLREQVKSLEDELQDLRDRYFVMSIRMAEREAQHEEALMKVRRLQTPIKHFTSSFK